MVKGNIKINLDRVLGVLDEEGYKDGMYDIENLKELELYNELYEKTGNEIYKDRLITSLNQIEVNSENYLEYFEAKEKTAKIIELKEKIYVREQINEDKTEFENELNELTKTEAK